MRSLLLCIFGLLPCGNLLQGQLIFGRPIPLFIFEILYAYAVGYTLYWLVVHALGKDYKRVAIGLYVIYSLINIVQAVGALVLVLPPLFYFLKTCASLSCAYYAFKIRKMTAGATLLTDEDNERSEPRT